MQLIYREINEKAYHKIKNKQKTKYMNNLRAQNADRRAVN